MATCVDNTISFKTGATVKLNCIYTDENDQAIDLTGYIIKCDFTSRKTGKLIQSTSSETDGGITINDAAAGDFTIDGGVSTDWPLGDMPVDIMYIINGSYSPTESFILTFTQGLTDA